MHNLTMKAKGSGKITCQFKTPTAEQHERISGPHSQSVEVKKNTFHSQRRLSLVKPGSQRGVSLFKTDPMTHGGTVKKKQKTSASPTEDVNLTKPQSGCLNSSLPEQ